MSENIEVGNLVAKISFDDTGLNKSMAEIDRQMKLVKSEFDKASSALKGYGSEEEKLKNQAQGLNQQMQLQQQRINKLNAEFQRAAKEKGEDAKETQNLAVKLNQAQTAYNNMENELKQVNTQLEKQQKLMQGAKWTQVGDQLTAAGDKLKNVGKQMTDVGKSLSMSVTAPIVGLGAASAKAAIDFESAFAGVRKTVDATEAQFAELEKGIRDMAKRLPATASDIALVGEAAGQLGIKTDNLLSFTEVMIGLGEATTMSADQAATELARLANITKMNQADFDKLGSSIVALGNNFATTEGEITEMALRLAGAGSQIGMSEADILGLAAALSSVGIEAEMGGSAISRVMVEMQMATSVGMSKVQELSEQTGMSLRDLQLMASNAGMDFAKLADSLGMTRQEMKTIVDAGVDLENFSKIAGMSAEEFKTAFEVDAIGALGAFINGLGNAEAAGESAINMLTEMGITEIRLRDSLLRAGGANELFAESINVSNKAWEENVALQNEVAQRYGTTESQLKMFRNQLVELGMQIGEIIIPLLMKVVEAVTPWVEKFAALDEKTQKVILVIAGVVAAIGPMLIIFGQVASAVGSIITVVGTVTKAIGAAGGALKILKVAFAAITGPVGIAIAAITGIIAVLVTLYKENEAFRKFVDKTWAAIKDAFVKAWDGIVNFFKTFDLKQIGKDLMNGLIKGITSMVGSVVESVQDVASKMVGGIKDFLGIKSPSRVMIQVGKDTGQGLANGIKSKKEEVRKSAEEIAKEAYNASREWIDERKYYNQLTLEQELSAWTRMSKRYKEGTEERKAADREVYRVQQEILKSQQQAEKTAFDNSKNWISEKKNYNLLTLTQELAAWERVQARYAEGTEERKQAEQEAARVRKEIYNELKAASDDYLAKVTEVNNRVAEEELRLNQVYEDAVASRTQSIYNFAGLFDEVTRNAEVSGQQLVENLRSQVSVMTEWAASLEQLAAKGVDEGLIAELQQMGPKAAAEIAALNLLTDDELNEYQFLWKSKNQLAREQAIEELEGLKNDTILKIQELNANAATELNKLQKEFEKRVGSIRTGTKNEFNALVSDMPAIGTNIIDGLIKGMDSMKGKLQNKASEMASSVSETIRKALDINSPSGVTMWMGEETGQGLVVGMGRKIAAITQQAKALSTAAIPSMGGISGGGASNASTGYVDGVSISPFAGATFNYYVRSESDIEAVNRDLYNKFNFARRGAGG